MKKFTFVLLAVLSLSVFAQEKVYITDAVLAIDKRNDIPDAKKQIDEADKVIQSRGGTTDPKQMNKFLFYKGLIHYRIGTSEKPEIKSLEENALEIAANSWIETVEFESNNNLKRYTPDAQSYLGRVGFDLAKRGYAKNEAKDFAGSVKDLTMAYEVRSHSATGQYAITDTSMLYNAALISSFAKDYQTAAELANRVLEMGYNGYTFSAIEVINGTEKTYASQSEMEQEVKLGLATDPKVSESIRPDIYKFLLSVYQNVDDKENFRKILDRARAEYPGYKDFIDYELDDYLKTGNFEGAMKVVDEAIEKDPSNFIYYYVKAYVYQTMKDDVNALSMYQKAIELNPLHFESNYSIGLIHYNKGKNTIEQMNNLGLSAADQKKYDQLKKVKENHFKDSLPFFEKCHEIDPKDTETVKALWEVYRQIGMPEKSIEMKSLLDSMQG